MPFRPAPRFPRFPRAVLFLFLAGALVAAPLGTPLRAGDAVYEQKNMVIASPWMAETPKGNQAAAAYFTLANRGARPDFLLALASPVATKVALHAHTLRGNVAQMREVKKLSIGPGENLRLRPGGMHVMFMGLKTPLKPGDQIPLVLTFKDAGQVAIQITVGLPKGLSKENVRPYGLPREGFSGSR